MYLLWYCELKAPVLMESQEELRTYIMMMRAVNQGTPRWERVAGDYFEGEGI